MEMMEKGTHAASAPEKILLSAHELFYLNGIRATGIDKIIAHASVTKVTFYRHFPSKNALILAYLDYRHVRWMQWFSGQLQRYSANGLPPADALVATLDSWWQRPDFRGCAFLNATAEIGEALPEVERLTREHKASVADALIATWQLKDPMLASVLVVALDGAIMHAQMGIDLATVSEHLRVLVNAAVNC